MNQAQKEAYLREYSILKNEGKPFFPYAVTKDAVMAVIVMIVIIFLAAMFGAEMGPKVNPTTTTYVPRPDWYFFFLFEVLRVMKNVPKFTDMATIGVPTICMILLFLLPFYDRSPERRIERRPVALVAGLTTIFAMAYLTYSGASAGPPTVIELATPTAVRHAGGLTLSEFEAGRKVVAQSGCLACHKLGDNGNNPPATGTTQSGQTQRSGDAGKRFQNLRDHLKIAGLRFAPQLTLNMSPARCSTRGSWMRR